MTDKAPDEFKVAVRATSTTVSLDEIERRIGMPPDRSFRIGEISPPLRVPSKMNGWFLDSGIPKTCTLVKHLDTLAGRIGDNAKNIAALSESDVKIQVSCGIFTEDYNFSPELPSRAIDFITSLNASLWLDIYFIGDSNSYCWIRVERKRDYDDVRTVHERSFKTDAEARLVDTLRANRKLIVSLVAEIEGEIVGHIAFSLVSLDGDDAGGIGLAPVAVLPEYQGKGIGGQLIRAGIAECERLGYGFVVLLGHPEYYPRFGFTKASEFNLDNEYGADDAFMAYEIKKGAIPLKGGVIQYSPEFGDL